MLASGCWKFCSLSAIIASSFWNTWDSTSVRNKYKCFKVPQWVSLLKHVEGRWGISALYTAARFLFLLISMSHWSIWGSGLRKFKWGWFWRWFGRIHLPLFPCLCISEEKIMSKFVPVRENGINFFDGRAGNFCTSMDELFRWFDVTKSFSMFGTWLVLDMNVLSMY